MKIVGVTACPTGIAHTYMSAEKLEVTARNLNHQAKFETQGVKTENQLSEQEIKEADAIILAVDKEIELDRFAGKKVKRVSTSRAIKEPQVVIDEALRDIGVFVVSNEKEPAANEKKPTIYNHFMNGVNYMLPFVIAGGIIIALSFAFGITAADPNSADYIDASLKSFDDNVQITKKVVALAHAVNVSVEAELGTIGNNGSAEGGAETIIYTDPDQAKIFVKETRIDTLAVALGTAHGLYPKNRTPKLNIDLLKELNQQIDLPFVLHGGSGNPDAEVSEAVKYGVAKVNLSSDLKSVFFNALREILSENPSMYEPNAIYPAANKKVQEVVKHKMEILNTVGKASLY